MQLASRPPLRRLLAIDRLLRSNRYPNARGLAAELEVSRRTVSRDLEFLRDSLGAPLEFSPGHNGYHYTETDYSPPSTPRTRWRTSAVGPRVSPPQRMPRLHAGGYP
jgi:predicted DNA-binding transcriptional regulator YafY